MTDNRSIDVPADRDAEIARLEKLIEVGRDFLNPAMQRLLEEDEAKLARLLRERDGSNG